MKREPEIVNQDFAKLARTQPWVHRVLTGAKLLDTTGSYLLRLETFHE